MSNDKKVGLFLTFVKNLGRQFPTNKVWTEKVLNPTADLNTLRSQIWRLRLEFWARKIGTYPEVIRAAKPEFRALLQKLRRPGDITYREIAAFTVGSIQVYGAFCIGEMWGRQNVFGYAVGPFKEYHEGLL